MQLRRIALRNYRNLEDVRLELGTRFTVLSGHNGAGKTNVLEAIYLVSTLRSFRSAELGPLVRHEAATSTVDLSAYDPLVDLETTLSVRLEQRGRSTRRTALADGKAVRSSAAFYGRVRAVLFTPEDLAILRGSPSGRRQFLDRMLFARDRAHIGDVQTYEKLLRSRNQVLKQDELPRAQRTDLLETYEAQLSEVGARIWSRRTTLLVDLAEPLTEAFERIHGATGPEPKTSQAPRAKVTVRYCSKLPDAPPAERAEALRSALAQRRPEDLRRKMTTVGPHRDDLEVELDDQPAGSFASQGQARALVLAFKLAELRVGAGEGRPPVLLLDDVSSELDPLRSAMLFDTLAETSGQCILTTTDARHVALPPGAPALHWSVARGRVVQAEL